MLEVEKSSGEKYQNKKNTPSGVGESNDHKRGVDRFKVQM